MAWHGMAWHGIDPCVCCLACQVSVGCEENHNVCVWSTSSATEWGTGRLQAHQASTNDKVFLAHMSNSGGYQLVTGGALLAGSRFKQAFVLWVLLPV